MDEYTTETRMRAHIIITLIVLWAISEHYGAGFSITALGPVQVVIPNWLTFLALGVVVMLLRRYREQVLGPFEGWMRWVLVGEEE